MAILKALKTIVPKIKSAIPQIAKASTKGITHNISKVGVKGFTHNVMKAGKGINKIKHNVIKTIHGIGGAKEIKEASERRKK
jgi:hypothetical protein